MVQFSVVIPTYNRRERVLRAVRSVLAQRFSDYEIIVVDDGSTDGTVDALRRLRGPIRTVRQKNRGPAAARTAGACVARGQYVAFLDSDDRWFPWTLATFAAAAELHPWPAWLYGRGVIDGDEAEQAVAALGPADDPNGEFCAAYFPDYATAAAESGLMPLPSGVAVAREVFLAHGGFHDLRVAEDLDLWFRLGHERGFVTIESPPSYARALGDDSLGENPRHAHAGMMEVVRRERRGAYGTDRASASVRRAILTRQLMYYADRHRVRGHGRFAARAYVEILRLQAGDRFREAPFGGRRNRFLLGFPLRVASPRLHARLKRALGLAVAPQRAAEHVVHDRG